MKKIVFSFLFILFAMNGFSQIDEPSFTIGVNSGFDYNYNAYYQQRNYDFGYYCVGIPWQYNIGIDFGVALTNNIRARFEIRYVNLSYKIVYDSTGRLQDAANYNNTLWNLNNWDIALKFDYKLWTKKKFDLYGTFGGKYEYNEGEYLQTHIQGTPTNPALLNVFGTTHPNNIVGLTLSAMLKYNITKNIGIDIFPEYTYFLRDFAESNTASYMRLSYNAGFEFKF